MKILEFLHGLTNWSDFVSSMKEIGRKKSPLLPKFVKPLHERGTLRFGMLRKGAKQYFLHIRNPVNMIIFYCSVRCDVPKEFWRMGGSRLVSLEIELFFPLDLQCYWLVLKTTIFCTNSPLCIMAICTRAVVQKECSGMLIKCLTTTQYLWFNKMLNWGF